MLLNPTGYDWQKHHSSARKFLSYVPDISWGNFSVLVDDWMRAFADGPTNASGTDKSFDLAPSWVTRQPSICQFFEFDNGRLQGNAISPETYPPLAFQIDP